MLNVLKRTFDVKQYHNVIVIFLDDGYLKVSFVKQREAVASHRPMLIGALLLSILSNFQNRDLSGERIARISITIL
jgi:hypothetical protein